MACRVGVSRVPGRGVFCRLRRRRGRRASFGQWARVVAGRLAVALVFAMAFPLFTATLLAQPPGQPIGVCMRNNSPQFQSGGAFAPDEPGLRGVTLIPVNNLVRQAVACAQSFAASTLVPIGLQIWGGLAIIITIWTGIQIMFGGGFAIGEIVSLILLLGFPYAILTFYNTDVGTPWGNMAFTDMVTGMGQEVSERLVDGAYATLLDAFVNTWNMIWDADRFTQGVEALVPEGWSALNPVAWMLAFVGVVMELFRNLITTVQMFLVMIIIIALLVIPAVVAYCSYLWGYLSIMVSVVIGPLMVPWFVVPQLQFLAWGWFRSLVGATVHLMVAGTVFAVVVQILTIPLLRVGQNVVVERGNLTELAIDGALLFVGGWRIWWKVSEVLVESLPLIVVAYLGVFKIGEITGMIMNGGSMPASGIGERMTGARNLGQMRGSARGAMAGARAMGGQAAAAAGKAGAAVVTGGAAAVALAASTVLSQSTKSR